MGNTIVYLSGGLRGDWRERVSDSFLSNDKVGFINPQESGRGENTSERAQEILSKPKNYASWNTLGIKNSKIVFVHVEKDNPSGLGAMVELGYAVGLGIPVILVVEPREKLDRYFDYGRELASASFDNLEDGIEFLKLLIEG